MIREKKDGCAEYFDLRSRMQYSKSMKFIDFNNSLESHNNKNNVPSDQMHLAAPQSNKMKNMIFRLRQGLEQDICKFCNHGNEQKS